MEKAFIENGRCKLILEFEKEADFELVEGQLVELQEGYGIGDEYADGVWQHHTQTNEEKAEEIHKELEELDKTINRATEDLYELTSTTPYTSTLEVINKKKELRQELRELEVDDNV